MRQISYHYWICIGSRRLKDQITRHLESYFGQCFERLCREALGRIYRREAPQVAFQVGEYWKSHDIQIDVVGLRADKWIDLGECKWGTVHSVPGVVAELEQKIERYPNPENASIGRLLFTRRPLRASSASVRCFALDDLYDR